MNEEQADNPQEFKTVFNQITNKTSVEISQKAGQVVWYSHLFQNFPVYCDPHKGFGIVNKAEEDVFLELLLLH